MEPPTKKKASSQRTQLEGEPSISSLQDLQVQIPQEIRDHLVKQYNHDDEHVDRILQAMKIPPATTVCRVNLIQGTREEIKMELEEELVRQELHGTFAVEMDPYFHDVLHVKNCTSSSTAPVCRLGLMRPSCSDNKSPEVFPTWPSRQDLGWPLKHRAVIVDRLCGEAVLRGSHIFVKGIMCADKGIQEGETIAVYADVRSTIRKNRKLKRGYFIEQYRNRLCLYLGLGISMRPRNDYFNQDKGVGIRMSLIPEERVGPVLPPLSGILPSKLYFQNLPSILAAHALAPQPGDVIIDMCAAPGGKTSHIASLLQNNEAIIVACDKSRTKMIHAQKMFAEMGATCITALALNTTACVLDSAKQGSAIDLVIASCDQGPPTVQEILESSSKADDGLLNVDGFYPESFDRILLDPPCSALGLRPKLQVVHTTLEDLQASSIYQKKFIRQAMMLLKPGGIMTYSTCTFLADENERMVHYMLMEYPVLELLPVLGDDVDANATVQIGQPGLVGMGLNDLQRGYVRRFDPCPEDAAKDTIGFFVAKFRKRRADEGSINS